MYKGKKCHLVKSCFFVVQVGQRDIRSAHSLSPYRAPTAPQRRKGSGGAGSRRDVTEEDLSSTAGTLPDEGRAGEACTRSLQPPCHGFVCRVPVGPGLV